MSRSKINSPPSVEPGGLLPRSKQSATALYLELAEREPHPHIFLQGPFLDYFLRFQKKKKK
jgi:hypothetical protein